MKFLNIFLLLLIIIGSINAHFYNNQGQLMSVEYNPWGNWISTSPAFISNNDVQPPNMNLMTVNDYNNNEEIGTMMNNGNYAPAFAYSQEDLANNDIQSMDESLIPAQHYYHTYNYDASPNYYGQTPVKPPIVLFEPKLLNHEIQSYVRTIDSSPLMQALFSIYNVPIPPPLILLTNFGDNSYRYLNNFDELRGYNQPPMRRMNDESEKEDKMADDESPQFAPSMQNTFKENSDAFNNFMQNAFSNVFTKFPSAAEAPVNRRNFQPSPFFAQPPMFPYQPQIPQFPIFKPEMTPRFDFNQLNDNSFKGYDYSPPKFNFKSNDNSFKGYDYTPPSLIQIGSRNTNIKSNSGNSVQRGVVQISDDEVEQMDTSTIESPTTTEDYETTTYDDDSEDRVDANVIKTLAG